MALLILLSLSIILFVWARGLKARLNYGLFDFHYLFVALYFGLYTLIDVSFGVQVYKDDYSNFIVFIHVLISLFMAMMVQSLFYKSKEFSFRSLLKIWADVPSWQLSLLVLLNILALVYSLLNYGFVFFYTKSDIAGVEFYMPSWVASFRYSLNGLLYGVYVSGLSKTIINKNNKMFSLCLIVVSGLIIAMLGRRQLISLTILALILFSIASGKAPYSLRNLFGVSASLLLIVLFSNLFQWYRINVFSLSFSDGGLGISNIYDGLINFSGTFDNLSERSANWQFNKLIVQSILSSASGIMWGELHFKSMLASLPSIIVGVKDAFESDELVAANYGLALTDYPSSNFSSLLSDFGFVSFVFYPLFVFLPMIFVSSKLKSNLAYYLIASGYIIRYLSSIEVSPVDFFILIRDLSIIWILFFVVFKLLRLLSNRKNPHIINLDP